MKYRVKDGDETYEIEEIEEEPKEPDMTDDDTSSLSEDEIMALKKLAAVADKLVDLAATADAGKTNATDEDEDEDVDVDEDDDEDDDDDVVVDTRRRHDSKKSFGSLEKRKKKPTADSVEVDEVADAWAKRYGGNK